MTEQALADKILQHALQILRLSAGEANQVEAILMEMARELRALILTADLADATKRDIEALVKAAEDEIKVGYKRAGAVADTYEIAVIVAEKTQEIMQDVIPVDTRSLTDTQLMSLGKDVLIDGAPTSAWWAKQSDDLAFRFAAQVRQGVANGETQEQIVARVVGRQGEPGILDVARRNARALVHSSVLSAANQARLATFRKNSRTISGVRFLATFDSHTCLRCAAHDGASWNLDGEKIKGTKIAFDPPPLHVSCRCILTPIPKTFREIGLDIPEPKDTGMRASSEGPISGKTTMQQFLKRQSPEFIANTLGKTRAELFMKGKLTISDLVSGTGRELSLAELRKH
jgi:SPP1 gp7 family putative phage head morphogenesis protein